MSGAPMWLVVVAAFVSVVPVWLLMLFVGLKMAERDQRKGGRRDL